MADPDSRLHELLTLHKLVGRSPAFLQALQTLPRIARSEAAVLISGETGTGKELAARALHYLSPRAGYPFVGVNCGALPDTLLEGELFGHERGAFTDAHARRLGLIAEAEGGTLFLDEVDSLPGKAQVALLRVLQEKRLRAVGSSQERSVNVRLLVAANTALARRVRAGTFREDLYYRLCVFTLHLPPLRERPEDIAPLAQHFLEKHAPAHKPPARLSGGALAALLAHDWPGNVRELENTMLRASHLCQAHQVEVEDLSLPLQRRLRTDEGGPPVGGSQAFQILKQQAIERFERGYLLRLMAEHAGNISRAAHTACKDRRDLGKLLKKYHIDPHSFQQSGPSMGD